MSDRQEKLEAIQDYLIKNIGELAEILEELTTECSEKFGFTVHSNSEEFFYNRFKDDPYSAILATHLENNSYDVDDEFLICYDSIRNIESFSRSYPHVEIDVNLADIAELIIKTRKHTFIAAMSNELHRMIMDL